MNTVADLIVSGALAAVWLTAGLMADGLPTARSALELHRRAGAVSRVVGGGAAVFLVIGVLTVVLPGTSAAAEAALLPAVPALLVLTVTWRRLGQVRRGAGAIAATPQTPVPPVLRAAAAHPLVAAPLPVTGVAALVGLPIAGGLVTVPGADVAGITITVVGMTVAAIGIRAVMRHSRLSLPPLAPPSPPSPPLGAPSRDRLHPAGVGNGIAGAGRKG